MPNSPSIRSFLCAQSRAGRDTARRSTIFTCAAPAHIPAAESQAYPAITPQKKFCRAGREKNDSYTGSTTRNIEAPTRAPSAPVQVGWNLERPCGSSRWKRSPGGSVIVDSSRQKDPYASADMSQARTSSKALTISARLLAQAVAKSRTAQIDGTLKAG